MSSQKEITLLKVSAGTDISKLQSSIVQAHYESPSKQIVVRSIGAAAVNQALKGVILANRNFNKKGLQASIVPYFKDIDIYITPTEKKPISSIEFSLYIDRL